MPTYYILKEPKETPSLTDILGKVDLIDTPDSRVAERLLRTGQCQIVPFGYSNGKEFTLRGFSIVQSNGQQPKSK